MYFISLLYAVVNLRCQAKAFFKFGNFTDFSFAQIVNLPCEIKIFDFNFAVSVHYKCSETIFCGQSTVFYIWYPCGGLKCWRNYANSCEFADASFDTHVVGSNGLEPSTSRLSGVCSNQLSYEPVMVEVSGFEPLTPCLQGRCSTSWAIPPYMFKRVGYFRHTRENYKTNAPLTKC